MDQETVARCLVADRAKLLAYIRSIVSDSATVEDLYQDVLVLALRKCAEIDSEAHLLNWARQAARFQAINHLRRRGREPAPMSSDVLDRLESHWEQIDQFNTQDQVSALEQCMETLTPYARQLLELRYVRGMSGKDVAAEVERTPHAVYTTLNRSYRALFECMERRRKGEDRA